MKLTRIIALITIIVNKWNEKFMEITKDLINLIKKHEIISIFIFIAFVSTIGCNTIHTKNKAKFIVSVISLAGVIFSYFYNKIMERKIALHSEAQWRPRLYNLMAKKKITYNDVLYFTAFFNVHKEKEEINDIDTNIRNALESILKDSKSESTNLNNELSTLYNVKVDMNTPKENLLSKFSNKDLAKPLEKEQIILFRACISELLKADWDRQK
ncbi:hypothetical protein A3O11_05555 [Ligilactobacillus aviarius]|nr:hypothetical protein A3O10_02530 [Ligilactobacillus aviarius]OAQ04292.1 hypothetical protein A3O11_05555 [Ligilactobacillus aviarius]OAS81106.1 hypothetical protein A3O18_00120 [Ligilactobacillus aviarius]PEG71443.1 hypothetical protein A3P04_01060 [Ligilactobacillus aviarius]PEG74353.1 hypothetical protein A3O82_01415 [Ligilactobacillus aviarius]